VPFYTSLAFIFQMQETQIAKKQLETKRNVDCFKKRKQNSLKRKFQVSIANCKRAREEAEKESDGG